MYVFLPWDDGKLENEGLKVEENGRLVQRDVTQYLLHACLGYWTSILPVREFYVKAAWSAWPLRHAAYDIPARNS